MGGAPGGGGGGGMEGGMPPPPGGEMGVPPPPPGGETPPGGGEMGAPPLSESRKYKILSMLGEEKLSLDDLFDFNKAQRNIYEIENKIKDILND